MRASAGPTSRHRAARKPLLGEADCKKLFCGSARLFESGGLSQQCRNRVPVLSEKQLLCVAIVVERTQVSDPEEVFVDPHRRTAHRHAVVDGSHVDGSASTLTRRSTHAIHAHPNRPLYQGLQSGRFHGIRYGSGSFGDVTTVSPGLEVPADTPRPCGPAAGMGRARRSTRIIRGDIVNARNTRQGSAAPPPDSPETPRHRNSYLPWPTVVLLSAPTMAASVLVVWALDALFGHDVGVALAVSWLASAVPIVALTAVNAHWNLLAEKLFQMRHPTPLEAKALDAAWSTVCAAAAVDPSNYSPRIRIDARDGAYAVPVRLVAVTTAAMSTRRRRPRQVEALLAHELAHLRCRRPWVTVFALWYSLPIRIHWYLWWLASRVLRRAGRTADRYQNASALIDILISFSAALSLLLSYVLRLPAPVYPLLIIAVTEPFLRRALDRRIEYAADAFATDLGYGPELVTFFRQHPDRVGRSTLGRLLRPHPPNVSRIAAINTRLGRSKDVRD